MRSKKLGRLAACAFLAGATVPTMAHADVVTFNFESFAEQSGLNSLTLTGGGLTATLLGTNFAITDISSVVPFGVPVSWGTRTLSPFDQPTSDPFTLNFSQGISGLSVEMGDFTNDADDLVLQLFSGLNGTGTLLGSASAVLPSDPSNFRFTVMALAVNGMPALSARFIGANSGVQSVFYDNITATFTPSTPPTSAVPEPGTLALMASGLFGVGVIRRRKRR